MSQGEVVVDGVWKTFRVYHQRSSTLKQAMLRRRGDVFEEFWALRDVSFEVPPGSTLGLIGANGAGKSTMLKVLSRILVPDKGAVRVHGRVSALLELGAGFHPELSGRENVFLNGTILGMSESEIRSRFDDIVDFAGMGHAIDNAVKTYSSGMQARLGFAVAIAIEPDILIIDEVLAVGDEQFQRRCLERIDQLRSDGRTAIFVSHGLGQVQQICDRAVWLDRGTVAASGPTEDVINAYLRNVAGNARIDAQGRERIGAGGIEIEIETVVGGEARSVVESGDRMTVRLHWSADRAFSDLLMSFRIVSENGIVVAGSQLHDGMVDAMGPGRGYLDYEVDELQLLPGSYHLSAYIQNRHTGEIYDGGHRLAYLDVMPRASHLDALGYFAMGGRWKRVDDV